MTNPASSPSVQISINEIQLLEFFVSERVKRLKEPLPQSAYEFQFSAQSKAISTDKALNIQLTVSLFEKRSEERKIEADKMTIPDVLAATCHGIAFSAARGMLVMSLQNTVISNAVLPIINPQVFLPPR